MRNNLVSTRLRIARNVSDYPFTTMMGKSTSKRLMDAFGAYYKAVRLVADMNVLETQYLLEKGIFSKEMLSFNIHRGLIQKGDLSILFNEEDHLRFQMLKIGDLSSTDIRQVIDESIELNKVMEYTYDEQMGFLTASVLNVGTGLKYSKLVHLPALVSNKYIDRVRYTASQLGITINEFKNKSEGNLLVVGSLKSLGVSEEKCIATVDRVIEQLMKLESDAEREQLEMHRTEIEDRIFKSYGHLKYGRIMTLEDAYRGLSDLLLGVNLELIGIDDVDKIKLLFFECLDGSLNRNCGKMLSIKERQIERAKIIRKVLGETYEIQS